MRAPFNDRGPFKVGEICIIVGAKSQVRFNGNQAVIKDVFGGGIYGIDVKYPDGGS